MRKKIISILLILILLQMACVSVFATTRSDLNNAKNNLSTATKNKKAVTAEKETILNEIDDLEDEIAGYQAEITELNSKITKMEKNIKEKNKEIEKLQEEYEEKKQLLADRLVAIYEQGRITPSEFITLYKSLVLLSSIAFIKFCANFLPFFFNDLKSSTVNLYMSAMFDISFLSINSPIIASPSPSMFIASLEAK